MRIIKLGTVSSALDMFDGHVDTQTSEADEISESFDVSGCNAVVCLNNRGATCQLEVQDDDTSTVYYDKTVSLVRPVTSWWDYYFAPVRVGRDLVFYFEAKENATATITITYTDGTAKCGLCLPGVASEIGGTQHSASVGIRDYSITTTNPFGITYFSVGTWAKRASADIYMATEAFDAAGNKFAENVGVPAVYDLNNYDTAIDTGHTSKDGYQALIIYGFCEDFDPVIPGLAKTDCTVDVQGLI